MKSFLESTMLALDSVGLEGIVPQVENSQYRCKERGHAAEGGE